MGEIIRRQLLICSMTLWITISNSQYQDPCTTPDLSPGNCIILQQCVSLYSELQYSTLATRPTIHRKLKKYNCGYEDDEPKVCCPITEFTAIDNFQDIPTKINNNPAEPPAPPDVTNHPNIGLLPTVCGTPDDGNRIKGGEKANLNEFPWMVLIAYESRGRISFQCGGSIISSRYILTAAHCLTNLNKLVVKYVRIGENDLRNETDCRGRVCAPPVKDYNIERIIPHPEYSGATYSSDIGLLRLTEPVDLLSGNADYICLPVSKEMREINLENKNVTVAGWGITDTGMASPELLKVSLPIVPNEQCNEVLKKSITSGISYNQICAGGQLGKDSCGGDSGGPLKFKNRVFFQLGIVSFGPKVCGTNGVPGVYTRVSYYMDWILDQMQS